MNQKRLQTVNLFLLDLVYAAGRPFYSYEVIKLQQYFSFLVLHMHSPRTEDTWGMFKGLRILLTILFIMRFGRTSFQQYIRHYIYTHTPMVWHKQIELSNTGFFKTGNTNFLSNCYAVFHHTGWILWDEFEV